ncbi:MAG TPA: hypothetical protein VHV08_07575 [Pirellulales bacterium]|nr:hypothetical protein [Pirellulales bacterium]
MDAHEIAAVETRLTKVNAMIDAVSKGQPDPDNMDRWRRLLNEKEQLEKKLALVSRSSSHSIDS